MGKAGRAETSTDPSPTNMNETIVHLKPTEAMANGPDARIADRGMDEKLRMPGVTNIWTQPIKNRIDMLSTGIRSQVGVKIFGNDLKTLEELSQQSRRSSDRQFRARAMSIPNRSAARLISTSILTALRPRVTASTRE